MREVLICKLSEDKKDSSVNYNKMLNEVRTLYRHEKTV